MNDQRSLNHDDYLDEHDDEVEGSNQPSDNSREGYQPLSRRDFISKVAFGFVGATAAIKSGFSAGDAFAASSSSSSSSGSSLSTARDLFAARATLVKTTRERSLEQDLKKKFPSNPNPISKDKAPYTSNFTKGLPHDQYGYVNDRAYKQLLKALKTGKLADFERVTLGGSKKLKNPLASYAISLDSIDGYQYRFSKAPPAIDSAEMGSETAELYWMALSRDVSFLDYESDATAQAAASDLTQFATSTYPRSAAVVNASTLYRFPYSDGLVGPYISQLMYADIPLGHRTISHKLRTVVPNHDYLADYQLWLFTQNGNLALLDDFDPTERYIRNGRDLGEAFHNDRFPAVWLNTAFQIQFGYNAHFNPGHPYIGYDKSVGFATFGYYHLQCLLAEVAKRAMWAEFVRKWQVWRRIRPEEYGGQIHNKILSNQEFSISPDILRSTVLDRTFSKNGTYLLPQAYPEGCPGHPSYGSGHTVTAGACATILKMWFDEEFVLPNPKVPTADGTALVDYTGQDAATMTVRSEVNKMAYNVAAGRMFGGVHYRSDCHEALLLGEQVAISYMESHRFSYKEKYSFTFTRFNGTRKTIRN